MSASTAGVRYTARLILFPVTTDAELLEAWARDRDDDAFAELVRRHQDMVYSSCLRKLRDPALAGDAAQQTFVTLSFKAGRLAGHTNLGGWLYKAALLESSSLLKMQTRRDQRHERFRVEAAPAAAVSPEENAAEMHELLRHLDDAMLDLKDGDREVLVLRFFENKPLRSIGDMLGTTEEAARKRVSRAIESLAGLFRRRGVKSASVAMLGLALSQSTNAAPPSLLPAAAATVKSGAAVAHSVKAVMMSKAKVALACTVAAASVPLALQWRQNQNLSAENAALVARVEALSPRTAAPAPAPAPLDASADPSAARDKPTGARDDKGHRRPPFDPERFKQFAELQAAARLMRVAVLKDRLGLSGEQEEQALGALQRAHDAQTAAWASARPGQRPDASFMQKGLRADTVAAQDIRSLLNEEQLPAYDAILEEDRSDRVAKAANRQFDSLQPLLNLVGAQKDSVYSILSAQAYEEDTDSQSDALSPDEIRDRRAASQARAREKLSSVLSDDQQRIFDMNVKLASRFMFGPPPEEKKDEPAPRPQP